MPEPLTEALAQVRAALLDPDLRRAVAAGRRRGEPVPARVEVRPVELKSGAHLQIVTRDGARPYTRNVPRAQAVPAVDELLGRPYGNWHVETGAATIQLRVTKRGEAQVHRAPGPAGPDTPTGHDREKEHLIDPGDPLFEVIGGNAAKRRQVDAFLRALAATIDPADLPGPVRVVDLGCGNAYLTFAAYRYLTGAGLDVRLVGVDVRDDQRERNTALARRLGWADRVRFVAGSIATARVTFDGQDAASVSSAAGAQPRTAATGPETVAGDGTAGAEPGTAATGAETVAGDGIAAAGSGRPAVDVVLALHACDTATDEALARAIGWGARYVLAAPCCHHDIAAQLRRRPAPEPYRLLTGEAILRERFADVLTDSLRAALLRMHGYRVDVVEFVESAHTPRNLLLRARRTGGRAPAGVDGEYAALVNAWQVTPRLATLLAGTDPARG